MSDKLQILLNEAAERGATRALERVGLHDEKAGKDVSELRELLVAWRDTKQTVRRTMVRVITTALLTALLISIGFKLKSS